MSLRGDTLRLRNSVKAGLDKRELVLIRFYAVMGDGEGNLYPDPDEPTIIYVRRTDRGRVDRVRNTRIGARNGLPVIIGYSPERPDELQVLDIDAVAMSTMGAYGYVQHHHQEHELFNPQGGDDTVWVWGQQFLPFLVQVTDPISLSLEVRSGRYVFNGVWRTFGGGPTVDMDTFAPVPAGQAVMVLISIEIASRTIAYDVSDEFIATLPEELRDGLIPIAAEGYISCAAVYVPNGITEVDWDVIYDTRPFVQPSQGAVPHRILSTSHIDTSPEELQLGDILVGQPYLTRMAIGGARELFVVNAAGDNPEWIPFEWDVIASAGGSDMVHDHSGNAKGGQNLRDLLEFQFSVTNELTINAGVITRTQTYHRVDTEGDAPTDDLDSIMGGTTGDILIIRPASLVRTIVVKHLTGNISLSSAMDITLDDTADHLTLIWNGLVWCDVGPAGFGSEMAWPGGAGYALVSTATSIAWDLTPTWLGVHTFGVGAIFNGGTNPLLDINPTHTDTACIINITPTAALSNIDAEWDGLCIHGDALDPSVVDVHLHGIHIDFSGVDVTNLPHIDGIHIETPNTYHGELNHALHIQGGGVWIDWYATSSVAGDTFTAINVVVQTTGATGGDTHILDVSRGGSGTVETVAVGTHTGVDVIHQHIGTFAASDKAWEWEAGPVWTDQTAAFGNPAVDVEIFTDDDDQIYISGTAAGNKFDQIEVILNTAASVSIKPIFEFSEGGAVWTQFYPSDDTSGFIQNGIIHWDASGLAAWAQENVNAEGVNRYWIRITRTRNNMVTAPIEDTIKVLDATVYYWDKSGDIYAANHFVPDGGTYGIDGNELLTFNAAGNATFSGVGSVVVPDGSWLGCNATVSWLYDATNDDVTTMAENVAIGTATPSSSSHFTVYNIALNIAAGFIGIYNYHQKTAGANAVTDDYYGSYSNIRINQAGSVVDLVIGSRNYATMIDGTANYLYGGFYSALMTGGTLNTSVRGFEAIADLNAGTVTGNVYGARILVDAEAAMTSIGGDIYGLQVHVDDDQGAVGSVYMLHLIEQTGVDYGVYQNGSAVNHFGGATSIGGTVAPAAQLHVDNTGAVARPVLYLDQGDVSEEMMEFATTIGVGNAIEAVGGKTLTTTHFIKVTIPGPLTRYIPVGTIA